MKPWKSSTKIQPNKEVSILNQLLKVSPDLAPEEIDVDGLNDFDAEVATNQS